MVIKKDQEVWYISLQIKTGSGTKTNVFEVLAKELHKQLVKKFRRRKLYARFKDNIWTADLDEMGSLSSMNQGVKYLLCVLVFNICAQVKPMKDKKA